MLYLNLIKERRWKMNCMKPFRRGEKGFTLIELLIVIAILGVISAAVIPNVTRFMRSGEKAACLDEAHTIQVGVDAAMAESGMGSITAIVAADPFEEGDTDITDGSTTVTVGDYLRRTVTGQYLILADGTVGVDGYGSLVAADITEINSKLGYS
jgi:prepilin-type N-terminal cleavage/methylation domain-containing protein